jgi:hypothetical protein
MRDGPPADSMGVACPYAAAGRPPAAFVPRGCAAGSGAGVRIGSEARLPAQGCHDGSIGPATMTPGLIYRALILCDTRIGDATRRKIRETSWSGGCPVAESKRPASATPPLTMFATEKSLMAAVFGSSAVRSAQRPWRYSHPAGHTPTTSANHALTWGVGSQSRKVVGTVAETAGLLAGVDAMNDETEEPWPFPS